MSLPRDRLPNTRSLAISRRVWAMTHSFLPCIEGSSTHQCATHLRSSYLRDFGLSNTTIRRDATSTIVAAICVLLIIWWISIIRVRLAQIGSRSLLWVYKRRYGMSNDTMLSAMAFQWGVLRQCPSELMRLPVHLLETIAHPACIYYSRNCHCRVEDTCAAY